MKKKAWSIGAAGVVGAVVVAGVGVGAWAAFADDGETTDRGTCAGTAYEISVEPDDGGLELSYELQSTGPGEVWQVLVEQGGTQVLAGERTTDEDGELDLDAAVDRDGADDFTVTVTSAEGETCTATLTR